MASPNVEMVRSILAEWDGSDPPLTNDWLRGAESGLDHDARPALRLSLLAALAPYRIDEDTVAGFRQSGSSDRDVVAAVAYGAFGAARRIGSWLSLRPARDSILSHQA